MTNLGDSLENQRRVIKNDCLKETKSVSGFLTYSIEVKETSHIMHIVICMPKKAKKKGERESPTNFSPTPYIIYLEKSKVVFE